MNSPDKIKHAVSDPKWKCGLMLLDGSRHFFITMDHPTLGEITYLIPKDEAAKLATVIGNILPEMGKHETTPDRSH